jgi:hypothetical protein
MSFRQNMKSLSGIGIDIGGDFISLLTNFKSSIMRLVSESSFIHYIKEGYAGCEVKKCYVCWLQSVSVW